MMKLPILPTQEIGSFKKPNYLIEVYKQWLRGEEVSDKLVKAIKTASIETIRLMEQSGLDIVWDGEMHRWEMYYHPVKYIDGIDFVGEVRIFDNKYFIKGSVVKPPKLLKNYHLEEYLFVKEHANKPVKLPVTGPYTLADWSFNEYYLKKWLNIEGDPMKARRKSKEELVFTIAKEIINPILKEIAKHNVFRIQIDEPAATTHPDEMDIFVEAFNKAVDGVDATITSHICYSDYTLLLDYINDLKTTQLALEFANRDTWNRGVDDESRRGYAFLKDLVEYSYKGEVGLGVVDVHTDRMEPVDLIVDRINYALKYIPAEKLFINPDCGLRTRSREIGKQKLVNMVEATKIVRKSLGIDT